MTGSRRFLIVCTLVLGAHPPGLLCGQEPARPVPPAAREADEKEASAREVRQIFDQAVENQLAAEKGGPDSTERLKKAAAGYRRVLETRPTAVAARYNLARAEEGLGDMERAARSYEAAASRKGGDQAFYLAAWAGFLQRTGRSSEAARAFEELVLLEPQRDAAFATVSQRFLEEKESSPTRLLDFLWKLVAGRQYDRAADLSLSALEQRFPEYLEPELLTIVAASLVGRAPEPWRLAGSDVDRRLANLASRPGIGRGVSELRAIYLSPGDYEKPFPWWSRSGIEWAEVRGVSRRDAFLALIRAVGDGYRSRGEASVAAACYEAAVELGDEPDPVALRKLATSYVENGRLDLLNALAARHADPGSRFFAAKNQAYRDGKLEKVLLYHRTLGQIYGSLALADKASWGDTSTPSTAMFQLERAYDVARRLDREAGKPPDGAATRVDADLAVLYAQGLESTGARDSGTRVRLDAAQTFVEVGDKRSAARMLRGVDERALKPEDAKRFETYRRSTAQATEVAPSKASALTAPDPDLAAKRVVHDAAKVTKETAVAPVEGAKLKATIQSQRAFDMAGPRRLDLPAATLWLDTGVDLAHGRALRITASGTWSNAGPPSVGPGGFAGYLFPGSVVASASLASLVGRIGETTFAVGERFDGVSPASGRLYLAINDTPETYGDNQGSLSVVIELP